MRGGEAGTRSRLGQRGFTLIELMMVVAMIAILSAIATPIFLNHMAISRQTEARVNLGGVYTAQLIYQSEGSGGLFAPTFVSMGYALGYTPSGWPQRYALLVGGGTVPATSVSPIAPAGADRINPVPGDPGALPPGCVPATSLTVPARFTAVAYGSVDLDATLDCWTMDETKALVNVSNDVSS